MTHKGLTEDSQRIHRRLTEDSAEDLQRTRRDSAEVLRGVIIILKLKSHAILYMCFVKDLLNHKTPTKHTQ